MHQNNNKFLSSYITPACIIFINTTLLTPHYELLCDNESRCVRRRVANMIFLQINLQILTNKGKYERNKTTEFVFFSLFDNFWYVTVFADFV